MTYSMPENGRSSYHRKSSNYLATKPMRESWLDVSTHNEKTIADAKSCDALLAALHRFHPELAPKVDAVTPPPAPAERERQEREAHQRAVAERNARILAEIRKTVPVPHWRVILNQVSAAHGVTVEDILGQSRKARIVNARQAAMARMNAETKLSLPEIGRRMGRDHTTVLHAIRKVAKQQG